MSAVIEPRAKRSVSAGQHPADTNIDSHLPQSASRRGPSANLPERGACNPAREKLVICLRPHYSELNLIDGWQCCKQAADCSLCVREALLVERSLFLLRGTARIAIPRMDISCAPFDDKLAGCFRQGQTISSHFISCMKGQSVFNA